MSRPGRIVRIPPDTEAAINARFDSIPDGEFAYHALILIHEALGMDPPATPLERKTEGALQDQAVRRRHRKKKKKPEITR